MGYDFDFIRFPAFGERVFPLSLHGVDLSEKDVARLEAVDRAWELLRQFPGMVPNGTGVRWEVPEGGLLYPRASERGFRIDTHASWEAVLELYVYLRDSYPDLVIMDLQAGALFDEESFRRFIASPDDVLPGSTGVSSADETPAPPLRRRPARSFPEAVLDMNYRDPETGEFVWEVCRAAHEDLKTYHALGEACLADFVAAFDHEESAVRRHAFQAVEMLGAKARDAVPALIAALETPEFPMYAATALGKLGPTGHEAIPKLIEVLEDYLTAPYEHGAPGSLPVSGNAGTILQTLEAFGPSAQGAVPTVVRCLEHPAPVLRVFACRALIAMERQRDVSAVAVRLLRETCSQAATGWHSEVTRLMGGLGPEARRLVPELCAMLGEDDPIVRLSAAMALEEIGEHATDAVGPLIATLSDTSARVRRHCISALSNLGESAGLARSALRRCEADADREVRRLATLALSRLSAAE